MMLSPRKRRKRAAHAKVREETDGFVLDLSWTDAHGIRRRTRPKFDSLRAATKAETLALRRLENGLPPFPDEESEPMTVRGALDLYHRSEKFAEDRPKSKARMIRHRADLERLIGNMELERVTYDDLLGYRRLRRETGTGSRKPDNVTVGKDLSHLRAAARNAKVEGKIQAHVFERLDEKKRRSLFPPEPSKGQVIEDADLEAILANIGPQYCAPLRLARLCGMRKGEFCGLTWADVQRDRIAIADRPGNKTGARHVPLTDEMRALLPPRRIDGSALVFTGPNGESLYESLGAAWGRARKLAGFPTLRVHDLRHTAATELDRLGGGDRVGLKAALGMCDATVARYAEHQKFDRARDLFEKVETRRKSGTETAAPVAARPEN